ncbi:hypothetical protein Q3G72_022040 [Acer saccharum]|nr:hypothetical protein Q3G72_022040 [Acer saccharum]
MDSHSCRVKSCGVRPITKIPEIKISGVTIEDIGETSGKRSRTSNDHREEEVEPHLKITIPDEDSNEDSDEVSDEDDDEVSNEDSDEDDDEVSDEDDDEVSDEDSDEDDDEVSDEDSYEEDDDEVSDEDSDEDDDEVDSYGESPLVEPVRIHNGAEENKGALRKSRGEEDEAFQILEYQAQKGNAGAMYRIGLFYYFGLRGLRRDRAKAADKGEAQSMEFLGEIYARGAGVERNYTKALEWLTLAARQQLYLAYNGMGYLHVKGYGVDKKNYTKAKEYFEKAAEHEETGGHYNLGVMYYKGIGVKRNVKLACKYFLVAANAGHQKAFYQLAKMFHTGVGLKKNLHMATALYKLVAERGPWSSLSRWALESYLKGDLGKAFLLYSRMAELGYEVAQSNAAWILDKYGERSMCMGESGLCTDAERHQCAHSLWWQASEQGDEHAALLIGDAYYYGRRLYMHAKSQNNAQAMFNLGYIHEHGQGLPLDLHLAKRYYDQAVEIIITKQYCFDSLIIQCSIVLFFSGGDCAEQDSTQTDMRTKWRCFTQPPSNQKSVCSPSEVSAGSGMRPQTGVYSSTSALTKLELPCNVTQRATVTTNSHQATIKNT